MNKNHMNYTNQNEQIEYRLLFQKSPDPIILVGGDTKIKMANPAFSELVGEGIEQIIGKSFFDYIAPEERQQVFEYHKKRRINPKLAPFRYKFTLLSKDGKKKIIDRTVILLPDGQTTLSILRDITCYKQLEAQLIQAQKMEAIGRLVAGIVHDFNNMLQAVMCHTQFLLSKLDKDNPGWKHAYEIDRLAHRTAELIHKLLVFSRNQDIRPRPINLNQLIDNMKDMICRIIGEDIQCTFYLDDNLWNINADASHIEQIIMNLIVNARDAMPHGGKLSIETKNVEINEAYASTHLIKVGAYVMLTISDTGIGMGEEVKQHAFEPFFTTKRDGTGLGLSTVYGIVKQYGGYIFVYSEINKGTTFKIYFPKGEKSSICQIQCGKTEPTLKGKETILIVEDEEAVREILVEMLKELGYKVIEAKNGKEGLNIAKVHSANIDVILTDIIMPHMDGKGFIKQISDLYPGIKVIYMSGYPRNMVLENNSNITFIQKPFTTHQLSTKLRYILEGST